MDNKSALSRRAEHSALFEDALKAFDELPAHVSSDAKMKGIEAILKAKHFGMKGLPHELPQPGEVTKNGRY